MGIRVKNEAAVPPGKHEGVIINAELTSKVFDPHKGPEDVVEITIQPRWRKNDDTQTLPVNVTFSPHLNGISALSKCLKRLGVEPTDGDEWEPASLNGVEVEFTTQRTERDFVRVLKDTLRRKEAS